mmetsp:Transcript_1421/g.4835  ORF Transcript_1421/g.4835 Transcript_1421/m.4835 type:complete len:274 (-) Transcript_1421:1095-1916(-)
MASDGALGLCSALLSASHSAGKSTMQASNVSWPPGLRRQSRKRRTCGKSATATASTRLIAHSTSTARARTARSPHSSLPTMAGRWQRRTCTSVQSASTCSASHCTVALGSSSRAATSEAKGAAPARATVSSAAERTVEVTSVSMSRSLERSTRSPSASNAARRTAALSSVSRALRPSRSSARSAGSMMRTACTAARLTALSSSATSGTKRSASARWVTWGAAAVTAARRTSGVVCSSRRYTAARASGAALSQSHVDPSLRAVCSRKCRSGSSR